MKYDKEAVIERVEAKLKSIEEYEESTYKEDLKNHKDQMKTVKKSRKALVSLIRDLAELVSDDELTDQDFKDIKDALINTRQGGLNWNAHRASWNSSKEVTRKSSRSDELRSVLKVFKTGAPPQVTVNDLRGFGLLDIVKYHGGR